MRRSLDREAGIEAGRLLGLAAIILLHAQAVLGDHHAITFALTEWCRFAVPFFFIVSGYFWRRDVEADLAGSAVRLFRKVMIPFGLFMAVYTALDHSALLYPREYYGSIRSYLLFVFTGGPGFHLWFLPALFTGTLVCILLKRACGMAGAFAAAAGLYAAGVSLSYVIQLDHLALSHILFRNGILFAPVFLMIGHVARCTSLTRAITPHLAVAMAALGLVIQMAEGFVLATYPKAQEMSFGTLALAAGMFFLLQSRGKVPGYVSVWGSRVYGAYLVHLLVLNTILARVHAEGVLAAALVVAATFVVSLSLSSLYEVLLAEVSALGRDATGNGRRAPSPDRDSATAHAGSPHGVETPPQDRRSLGAWTRDPSGAV